MSATPPSRIEWLSDLVRLEIALWNRIDARLRQEHNLSLAHFETIYIVGRSRDEHLRVGEIATALGTTVGGTSKIVDRIERAGLLRREPDASDRRASHVALTDAGRNTLREASATFDAEMARLLDAALSVEQQNCLHALGRRLLDATEAATTTPSVRQRSN